MEWGMNEGRQGERGREGAAAGAIEINGMSWCVGLCVKEQGSKQSKAKQSKTKERERERKRQVGDGSTAKRMASSSSRLLFVGVGKRRRRRRRTSWQPSDAMM